MNTSISRNHYIRVWLALLALLFASFGLAEVNLGAFNTAVGLGIAVVKLLLVVLFFMHGRFEKPITWIFITAGVIWLAIMVDLTLSDYLTRGDAPGTRQSWRRSEQSPPNTSSE